MLKATTSHTRCASFQHQRGSGYQGRQKNQPPDGRVVESCYWEKKPLEGRVVTLADVIKSYRKDFTSLRPGYFLQNLCLQRIPLTGRTVTADEVIAEFKRKRDANHRCDFAIAKFTETCFWRELKLNGKPVTPEQVLAGFPDTPKGREARGHFRSQCWQKELLLHGRQVTIDEVISDYRSSGAILELAMVLQQCCLEGHLANRPRISADIVASTFPRDNQGQLGLARFMADCFEHGLLLAGKCVRPEDVIKQFPQTPLGLLGRARFKQACFLNMLLLDGKNIVPEAVAADFPDTLQGRLALARFKQECCLNGLSLFGRPILPEAVISQFPNNLHGRLGIGRFLGDCCLRGLEMNGEPVKADTVVQYYKASNANLELGRFLSDCCLQAVPLHGQPVPPDVVLQIFQDIKAWLELARFKSECCLQNLTIDGHPVTADEVIRAFPGNYLGKLAVARFKAECCAKNILVAGQQVTPQMVATEYQELGAWLELGRFMESQCLLGLPLNGQAVLAEAVLQWFPNSRQGRQGAAYFKLKCCLKRIPLGGKNITPDQVVNALISVGATMELAHFKEECCLRGLPLAGRPVTPAAVLAAYPKHFNGILDSARFLSECCLKGIPVDGNLVLPETVLQAYNAARARLERARFMADCCLRGLSLFGRRLTTEAVAQDFPLTREGRHGLARFLASCCLQGLQLNGQLVTTKTVVDTMKKARAPLDLARFKADCCLRCLRIDGQPLLPDYVLESFPRNPEGKLGRTRFKEECFFKGFQLNGGPIQPEDILKDYHSAIGRLNALRFRERCCLDSITLSTETITPEAVCQSYEQGGWQLEQAVFLSLLATDAKPFGGHYLSDDEVLAAFNKVPGNHSVRQVRFLIHRLNALPELYYSAEARDIWQKAWRLNRSSPVRDGQSHLQHCVLRFLAMHHGLMVDGHPQSVDQVWQSIVTLRDSFRTTRLRFFFLNYCGSNGLLLNGQPVQNEQVVDCLNALLPGSKLQRALSQWYRNHNSWTQIPSQNPPGPIDRVELSPLVLTALKMVQDINDSANQPILQITGSFSRYLQGLCTTFKDIDILGTPEAVQQLICKLSGRFRAADVPLPCQVSIWPIPGCSELRLPQAFNIVQTENDLGHETMGIQASICPSWLSKNALAIHLPGNERALMCMPFAGEVRLMNETLQYLTDHLVSLSERLQRGDDLIVPRTIVFNAPVNAAERVCGLLMRCLLTLNKARQFAALINDRDSPLPTLRERSRCLRIMVQNHSYRAQLVAQLSHACSGQNTGYPGKKCAFIRTLLDIVENPAELF